MLMNYWKSIVFFVVIGTTWAAAQTEAVPVPDEGQKSAIEIMDQAVHQARKSHKPILVMFQSSFSDWCRQLDSALTLTKVKSVLEKSLVIAHVNVAEQQGQQDSLVNPGGNIMMQAFAGGNPLLPFGVVLNKRGRKISDSQSTVQSAVYPAGKEHLMAFINLLKQYVPKITPRQLQGIVDYFQSHPAPPDQKQ